MRNIRYIRSIEERERQGGSEKHVYLHGERALIC
jgi:hypothetical protein